jgi:A1 cistron-splicing factor AAR2
MESANSPALLLLDLTPAALAGIDLLSFTTTPRFRGVKDVPTGLHFTFTGANAVFSERHGLWFDITKVSPSGSQQPLIIARWDSENEVLKSDTNPTELLRWRANLGEFWREGLTPYRQSSGKGNDVEADNDWSTLTSHITPSLLTRITGSPTQWRLGSGSSATQDIEAIPGFSATDLSAEYQRDQILHFLPINLKQTWRPGALGAERSKAAQDRSWALLNLLPPTPNPDPNNTNNDNASNLDEILGELQFTFLTLLTLNNFSCLEQWKRLLTLIFTSTTAVFTHPEFFIRAIAALRLQLQHCKDAEGGLIDLADEGGSLLAALLGRFRRGLERSSRDFRGSDVGDVVDELDDLEDYLREQHGWRFDDEGGGGGGVGNAQVFRARSGILELEDGERVRATTTAYDEEDEIGEFAPEVVELTAEQRRMIGGDYGDGEGADRGREGEVNVRGSDWGTKRDRGVGMMGKGLFVEDRTVQRFVVDESEDDDDDDDDDDHDGRNESTRYDDLDGTNDNQETEEDEEEEMQDLEDMDSRY